MCCTTATSRPSTRRRRVPSCCGSRGIRARVRGIFDYTGDSNNGINVVAVKGSIKNCETSYLGGPRGGPGAVESVCANTSVSVIRARTWQEQVQMKDVDPASRHRRIQQYMERVGRGGTLDIEKAWSSRHVQLADRLPLRPTAGSCTTRPASVPRRSVGMWPGGGDYVAWTDTDYGPRVRRAPFRQPVLLGSDIQQWPVPVRATRSTRSSTPTRSARNSA